MRTYDLSQISKLVAVTVGELRDKSIHGDRWRFRSNMERLGEIIAVELSKTLEFSPRQVESPLGTAEALQLSTQPVIVGILRAGIPLQNGVLKIFPQADVGYIGTMRKYADDGSFTIESNYVSSPSLKERVLILCDPMLATGQSMLKSAHHLMQGGEPNRIIIVSAVAAPEGLSLVEQHLPSAEVWCGAIDQGLNSHAYIVPGLGDAGDLAFGTKV